MKVNFWIIEFYGHELTIKKFMVYEFFIKLMLAYLKIKEHSRWMTIVEF